MKGPNFSFLFSLEGQRDPTAETSQMSQGSQNQKKSPPKRFNSLLKFLFKKSFFEGFMGGRLRRIVGGRAKTPPQLLAPKIKFPRPRKIAQD